MNTLAVQLTLPLAGCVEDLHLQVVCLTTTVNRQRQSRRYAPCSAHNKKATSNLLMALGFLAFINDCFLFPLEYQLAQNTFK
ncbi:TPA: hypothetical protein ACUTE1_000273 [Proteus mirabilis]